jgi:hypothetical protein
VSIEHRGTTEKLEEARTKNKERRLSLMTEWKNDWMMNEWMNEC